MSRTLLFEIGLEELPASFVDGALAAMPTLATDALDALRARGEAHGHPTKDDSSVEGRYRFFTEDPFGNRIEFMDRTPRT